MKRRYIPCLLIPAFLLTSCQLYRIFNKTSSGNHNTSHKEGIVPAFQVSLKSLFPKVRLSQNSSFTETVDTITEETIPPLQEFTFAYFKDNYSFEYIDNENTSSLMGGVKSDDGDIRTLNFYKCTFFVKNVSEISLDYDLRINITKLKQSENGISLDDVVRFGIFEDGNLTVLAKKSRSPHLDADGENDYREAISVSEEDATESNPFNGYAEMFESENVITTRARTHLGPEENVKYTMLFWFEGFDPENNSSSTPIEGAIRFGVTISDYETN